MSVRTPAYLIPVFVLLAAPAAAQLSIQDLSTQTPTDLVNAIVGGGGVGVSNVTYAGDAVCAGTFTGGTGIVGFETGLILSTGNVNDAIGPNISGSTTGLCGGAGDTDLDTLIPGFTTLDASVLEFDFECSSIQFITFNYVFASEEYNEYVNSAYNDAFGFFVNGVNAALLPDGITAVTIDTVNNGLNPGFYTTAPPRPSAESTSSTTVSPWSSRSARPSTPASTTSNWRSAMQVTRRSTRRCSSSPTASSARSRTTSPSVATPR